MTAAELRRAGLEILTKANFSFPQQECDYLVSGVLQMPLLELKLAPENEIPSETCARLMDFFHRRANHEPAQYILETAPFRDLDLNVTPAVLIPRPETEELVTLALEHAPRNGRVLDMGTGSGAIPAALKYERPDLQLTAADLSPEALQVARLNAQKYALEIEFIHSDLWSGLEDRVFDLVTANLPYVSDSEYLQCEKEIFFEPRMALTAPHEGLELMEKMIRELSSHLVPGGWAIFELSPQQNEYICNVGRACNFTAGSVKDLEGKARFVMLCRES